MTVTKEQLFEIIKRSEKEQTSNKKFGSKYFPTGSVGIEDYLKYMDTHEFYEYEKAKNDLKNYLNSLDYEAILDIEALMDYGRELSQYDGISNLRRLIEDEYTERTELVRAEDYFATTRRYFAQSYPSPEGKSDAITYLSGKPLAQYLSYAMEALEL